MPWVSVVLCVYFSQCYFCIPIFIVWVLTNIIISSIGRSVVVVGDLNVSAFEIDHCSPWDYHYTVDNGESSSREMTIKFEDKPHVKWFRSLLLPNENLCLSPMTPNGSVSSTHLVDSFRLIHPKVRVMPVGVIYMLCKCMLRY